nr:venom polypeptide precursor [Doratifera vulnerans]
MRAVVSLILFVYFCTSSHSKSLTSSHSKSLSHNLYAGQPHPTEILVFETTQAKIGVPLTIRKTIIKFPEEGKKNDRFINNIIALDNIRDGKGGYASVIDGGVGQKHAKIKIESERSHGFNFTIRIYASK